MPRFSATVEIIDINPYVHVPDTILQELFKQVKKSRSPIPVKGALQGKSYKQTAIKFRDVWRLYLNTQGRALLLVSSQLILPKGS